MQPTLIETERKKRERSAKSKPEEARALSPAVKARVIGLFEEGMTITELFRTLGMPNGASYWRACDADPAFATLAKQAQARGAAVKMALAQENAEREAESRDPDRARVAQSLCAVTMTYAEKIAPKEFGQLVKLGSDGSMPFAVHVINYGTLEGGALTQADSTNDASIARGKAKEIASPLWDDADAAQGSEGKGSRAVPRIRPRTSRRGVAKADRQKAKAKARN
jgi:hypothetical protein